VLNKDITMTGRPKGGYDNEGRLRFKVNVLYAKRDYGFV